MKKVFACVLVFVMALSGCAFAAGDGKWHLGILVHSMDNEFWAQEANGGILFADSKDDVEYQVLATEGDDNREIQAIS